jgi:transposase
MPPRTVSRDLKASIPILRYEQGYEVKEICDLLGIKKTLVYQTLKYHHLHGLHYNPLAQRATGRPRSLSPIDISFIRALLTQRHCIYVDEIQEELLLRRGVRTSVNTILRTLRRLHFSRKRVSARALERNELRRSAFMNRIADEVPDANMLMFIDEAAKNQRTSGRNSGWSLVGKRCVARQVFVRGQRYSILPLLTLDGIIAYDVIEGSVTGERFLEFIRDYVVCFVHFI